MTTSRRNSEIDRKPADLSSSASVAPRKAGRHFKQPEEQLVGGLNASAGGQAEKSDPAAVTPDASGVPVTGLRFKPLGEADTQGDDASVETQQVPKIIAAQRQAVGVSRVSGSSSHGGHGHHGHRGSGRSSSRRRRKMPLPAKIILIVVVVLACAGGGTALALKFMVDQGAASLREASSPEEITTAEDANTADEGITVEYNGTTYRYNENIVSIVVMGYDRREDVSVTGAAGQADAVMVVALDTQTGEMRVIGVPRDTMVDVDENVGDAFIGQGRMQLALSFSYGDGYGTSANNVVRAVSRILYNMPMNYYVALDMSGIGPLNDAIGGVTITPLASIPSTSIEEGVETTLYGYEAMRYVQYRDTSYMESSLDRQARQSQYLQAFFSQAISTAAGDPAVLIGLYQTALEYGFTNLGASEFAYLATVLVEHGMSSLDVTTLAGTPSRGAQYVEYELDLPSVYQTVLDVYYEPVEETDAAAEAGE